MYWADVQISNQSNNNTSPQFGNLRLRPGSANYGSYLRFGDGDYAFIAEQVDDKLTYKAGWHNFVTGQVNAAVGLRLGGAVSGTSLSGGCLIEWDSQNNAIKVNGNIYATGFVSALGAGSGGSSGTLVLDTLTINSSLEFGGSSNINYDSYDDVLYFTTGSNGFSFNGGYFEVFGPIYAGDQLEVNGSVYIKNNGGLFLGGSRLYLDATRYIYGSNGHLYFYNGSTTITLA